MNLITISTNEDTTAKITFPRGSVNIEKYPLELNNASAQQLGDILPWGDLECYLLISTDTASKNDPALLMKSSESGLSVRSTFKIKTMFDKGDDLKYADGIDCDQKIARVNWFNLDAYMNMFVKTIKAELREKITDACEWLYDFDITYHDSRIQLLYTAVKSYHIENAFTANPAIKKSAYDKKVAAQMAAIERAVMHRADVFLALCKTNYGFYETLLEEALLEDVAHTPTFSKNKCATSEYIQTKEFLNELGNQKIDPLDLAAKVSAHLTAVTELWEASAHKSFPKQQHDELLKLFAKGEAEILEEYKWTLPSID